MLEALVRGGHPEHLSGNGPEAEANLAMLKELAGIDKLLAVRSRDPEPAAGARRQVHPARAGRRSVAHAGDPADRPQSPRLRSVPDSQRLCGCRTAPQQAQRLIEKHIAEGNALPETVAIVLWGTDNLKNEGAPIGQALAMLGARPRFDSYGRLTGADLMPLDRTEPAADRRHRHDVRHLPRPAAAADQAAGRSLLPGGLRR